MGNAEWPQRMREALSRHAGEDAADEIMGGCEDLADLDEVDKSRAVKVITNRIDNLITDQETRVKIMTDCSCRCYAEFIEEFRREYRRSQDIDKLLDAMHGKVFMVKPVREGNVIYVTKAPRFPEKHARASAPQLKRYYYCHCDYARATKGDISRTYCLCGAGWCKRIWEQVLERPVRVELLKSVLQGDEICRFAVYL
ncbi:MAG: hypothetical protein JSW34_00080 [Candidatus Zixiibacteriota bacterium]|nr:MAG: hypothetical protein JSW34_00080 [candidate division Zixibacteria bacterium]